MYFPPHQRVVEESRVAEEREEDEHHAGDHPGGDGRHPLHVRREVRDRVEDVDQHQELIIMIMGGRFNAFVS